MQAVKVKFETLDYGWMFKITSFLELMDYHEKVRANRIQSGFSNLLRSRELESLTGVSKLGNEHMSHPDAFGIYSKCLATDGTCFDAVASYATDLLRGMLRSLEETGAIYVNNKGGYFSHHPRLEEYASKEITEWVLPGETISITQWPGGTHWYASVGGRSVTRYGVNKWSTKTMAQTNAEKWAEENGVVLETVNDTP